MKLWSLLRLNVVHLEVSEFINKCIKRCLHKVVGILLYWWVNTLCRVLWGYFLINWGICINNNTVRSWISYVTGNTHTSEWRWERCCIKAKNLSGAHGAGVNAVASQREGSTNRDPFAWIFSWWLLGPTRVCQFTTKIQLGHVEAQNPVQIIQCLTTEEWEDVEKKVYFHMTIV